LQDTQSVSPKTCFQCDIESLLLLWLTFGIRTSRRVTLLGRNMLTSSGTRGLTSKLSGSWCCPTLFYLNDCTVSVFCIQIISLIEYLFRFGLSARRGTLMGRVKLTLLDYMGLLAIFVGDFIVWAFVFSYLFVLFQITMYLNTFCNSWDLCFCVSIFWDYMMTSVS